MYIPSSFSAATYSGSLMGSSSSPTKLESETFYIIYFV